MSTFWLKTLTFIYDLILISLGATSPFMVGLLVYQFIKPTNYIVGILFIIVWIILCFFIVGLGFYFIKILRNRFELIDEYLEIIESYRQNR